MTMTSGGHRVLGATHLFAVLEERQALRWTSCDKERPRAAGLTAPAVHC